MVTLVGMYRNVIKEVPPGVLYIITKILILVMKDEKSEYLDDFGLITNAARVLDG